MIILIKCVDYFIKETENIFSFSHRVTETFVEVCENSKKRTVGVDSQHLGAGMLVVSLRGKNSRIWYRLG